ncbi:MAG: hypothetical protein H7Z40_07335 [Phycisphaerae bacterium]|nr:hypothetical protein [Gemmatimonadaceae bacterium]
MPQHAGSVADAERVREPRLPAPLPAAVWRVARANLMVFGVLSLCGVIFVCVSGIAVVLFPIVLGREGVGRAMITLFLCCSVAVSTGLALLAARSAARVIRRERRGVSSLLAFVQLGAIVSVFAGGIVWWLIAAFFADRTGGAPAVSLKTLLAIVSPVAAFMFCVWGVVVLRRYRKSISI